MEVPWAASHWLPNPKYLARWFGGGRVSGAARHVLVLAGPRRNCYGGTVGIGCQRAGGGACCLVLLFFRTFSRFPFHRSPPTTLSLLPPPSRQLLDIHACLPLGSVFGVASFASFANSLPHCCSPVCRTLRKSLFAARQLPRLSAPPSRLTNSSSLPEHRSTGSSTCQLYRVSR